MRRSRFGTLLQQQPELLERTIWFLSPQAAVREHLVKLGITGVGLAGRLQILSRQVKFSQPVIAHAQQRLRLRIVRVTSKDSPKSCDCGLPMFLLKFRKAKI